MSGEKNGFFSPFVCDIILLFQHFLEVVILYFLKINIIKIFEFK